MGVEVPGVPIEVVYPVRASPEVIDLGSVVGVVVTVAVMVVITAVPGAISVKVIVVVDHRAAAPVAIPGTPSPSAAVAARQCVHGDSGAEAEHTGSRDIAGGVSRGDVRRAVDHSRIVFGDVYDL